MIREGRLLARMDRAHYCLGDATANIVCVQLLVSTSGARFLGRRLDKPRGFHTSRTLNRHRATLPGATGIGLVFLLLVATAD